MPAFTGKRILVGEDEALVAMMLAQELMDLGFAEVRTAVTLSSAMASVMQWTPDVALLDVNLSDGVSLPVAHWLANRGVPTVFMSGDPEADRVHGLPSASALCKPFAPADMSKALEAALASG